MQFAMNRARWRKVLSDLWSNKIRSLLVIASIAIGLFALGLIAAGYVVLSEDMEASYRSTHPPNLVLLTDPFDDELVSTVERTSGVQAAEGGRTVYVRLNAGENPVTGEDEWISLNLRVIADFDNQQIGLLSPLWGDYPPGDREIVLDINKLSDSKAEVGDFLEIKLPSGTVRSLPLVGVVQDQSIGAVDGTYFTAPAQGYITFDTLSWLEQPDNYNQLFVVIDQPMYDPTGVLSRSAIEAGKEVVRNQIESSGREVLGTVALASGEHPNMAYVVAVAGVLFLLGLLVVFLSGFLVTNTLSALLQQQVLQIGVMKAVGARRGQIMMMYLVLILSFGLLASLASVPIANRVSYALAKVLANELNFNLQGFRIIPEVVLLQLVIGLVLPLAAGIVPVIKGSRVTVREAISGYGLGGGIFGESWIDRLVERIRGLSRPALISLRNTFRRKGRLLLTMFTLTLGGAIFIATFNVQFSLEQYIEQIGKYFQADVDITFDQSYRIEEIEQLAMAIPGVMRVEGWAAVRSELVLDDGSIGENVNLYAPPVDSSLIEPILIQGRWILPGDTNAITLNENFLARYPDLEIGDNIRLNIDGRETEWIVTGVFQFVGGNLNFFLAYANYDYLSELIHKPYQASAYKIVMEEDVNNYEAQKQLSQHVDTFFREEGFHVRDVDAGLSLLESVTEGLNILTLFLMIMAVLTALVGSIGLMGTMSMSVLERTREIGVMRSIGATNWMIIKMVIGEGLIIGLISWALSVVVAFPISKLMADIIVEAIFNAPAQLALSSTGFITWFVMVVILSLIASYIPARNASRLTVREVLSYE
jgi:putative ABC transport system permease protein